MKAKIISCGPVMFVAWWFATSDLLNIFFQQIISFLQNGHTEKSHLPYSTQFPFLGLKKSQNIAVIPLNHELLVNSSSQIYNL